MTAKELIDDLSKLDPYTRVLVTDNDGMLGELDLERVEVEPEFGNAFLLIKE